MSHYFATFPHFFLHSSSIYLILGPTSLFPVDTSPCPVLSPTVLQLFPPRFYLYIFFFSAVNRWKSLDDSFRWCDHSQCRFFGYAIIRRVIMYLLSMAIEGFGLYRLCTIFFQCNTEILFNIFFQFWAHRAGLKSGWAQYCSSNFVFVHVAFFFLHLCTMENIFFTGPTTHYGLHFAAF